MKIRGYEEKLWEKARRTAMLLQLAPFVRFVAVTGSLGRGEAKLDSDADLFIITEPGRLYTARAFALLILKLTGQRINVEAGKIGGAVDPNYWLTSDNLNIQPHNAFVARDYSFMVPLWDFGGYFARLIKENGWINSYQRSFRDTASSSQSILTRPIQFFLEVIFRIMGGWFERWSRSVQEKNVRDFASRQGKEDKVVISDSELRLHL